ncbi:MAG: GTP-binding protein [Promethearchaeota archaeon]|jgi:small GTP-binding protein
MYEFIFKIVIFGEGGCGKTTLRKRFMTNVFDSHSQKTIGVEFETKEIDLDGKEVKLMIWDFAGEERFRYMFPKYIYGAMGGILMYDISDYSSFSRIGEWLSLINGTNQRFPIILLGGKSDKDFIREISWREGEKFARSMNLYGFTECSSKTCENVKESFETLTRIMVKRMEIMKTAIPSIKV